MRKRGLGALREALTAPLDEHVDDETMALLVTAEAAGEEIEETYATPLAHIERCVTCAESYAELAQMMVAAITEMEASADAVEPEEVYASLLAQELERGGLESSHAGRLAAATARAFPLTLTGVPAPEEVDAGLLQMVLETVADTKQFVPDLARAVQRTASSLDLYLQSLAQAIWERHVVTKSVIGEGWNRLQIAPARATDANLLREPQPEWTLFDENVRHPWPFTVEARAERLDTLSCRLLLQLSQARQITGANWMVRLRVRSRTWTAVTDREGMVQFEPLPIAALPELMIEVDAP